MSMLNIYIYFNVKYSIQSVSLSAFLKRQIHSKHDQIKSFFSPKQSVLTIAIYIIYQHTDLALFVYTETKT